MSRLGKGKPPQRTQSCAKCGYIHETSKYFRVTGACFACGKLDHKVNDCPLNKKKEPLPPKTIAHTRVVYAITEHDSRASKSVVEGVGPVPRSRFPTSSPKEKKKKKKKKSRSVASLQVASPAGPDEQRRVRLHGCGSQQ
ncbi:hypothetical protein BHE74_00033093 [Ensete ventricosum]|nr:hypothetical protein BHE74_00033093 [Ensete ventricosum]